MKREWTNGISRILDYWIPPVIREWRPFYRFVLGRVVGGDVDQYLDFRDNAWRMSDEEMQAFYASVFSNIKRPTDCTAKTVERVMQGLVGQSVLEFGCGRGFLATRILAQGADYTGVDFDTSSAAQTLPPKARLFDGTDLSPVEGEHFDTVICTHTLEHTLDIRRHVRELLAATRQRLIIVVPLQLNLKYTPDLHTHWFRRPGDFFLAAGLGREHHVTYWTDDGDLCVFVDVGEDKEPV